MKYTTKEQPERHWDTIKIGAIHRQVLRSKATNAEFEVVQLEDVNGNIHSSAFAKTWDEMNIDMSKINYGDELLVEYKWSKGMYRNFTRVVVPLKDCNEGESTREIMDEMFPEDKECLPPGKERRRQAAILRNANIRGTHWYTDGEKSVRAKECPEGFFPGMTTRRTK